MLQPVKKVGKARMLQFYFFALDFNPGGGMIYTILNFFDEKESI
jgi:hypothetical protein